MPQYDLMNGGLKLLINELNGYASKLEIANQLIVEKITRNALRDIQTYGQMVSDKDERSDVINENRASIVHNSIGSVGLIKNYGQQTPFAEYGYGIVGSKSPYPFFSIWGGQGKAGYGEGYDVDSPHKSKKDRGWRFKDRHGQLAPKTLGKVPVPTFYLTLMNATLSAEQITKDMLGEIFK